MQEYGFDANGNRTSLTVTKDSEVSETFYTYDANDRLTSETKGGVTVTYGYDNNGNMTGKSDGVVQTFDLLNRMVTWTDGTDSAIYAYNPDNMRRSKTVNSVTTEHIWLGSEIALDISGGNVVSYVQGRGGAVKSGYGWYVYDAHGDVVQICDDGGNVTRAYDYDPFGVEFDKDGLDENPYRYCGEYYDSESGYTYLRARYYSAEIGRFISEDPAFDGWNWYNYIFRRFSAKNSVILRHLSSQGTKPY